MKSTGVFFLMLSAVYQVICASATCTEQATSTVTLFVTDIAVNNSDIGKTTALAMGSSYNGTVSIISLTGALTNPLVTTLTETMHVNSIITVPGSTSTDETFVLSMNSSGIYDLSGIASSMIPFSTTGFVASDDAPPVSTIIDSTALTSSYVSSVSIEISTSITITSFLTSTSTLILTIPTNTHSNIVSSVSSYTTPGRIPVTTITVSPVPLVVVASNSTVRTATVYNLNTTLFGTVYVVPTSVSNSTQTVRLDHPESSVTARFTNGTSGNITASLASVITHQSQGSAATSRFLNTASVFTAIGSHNKIPSPIIWLMMIFKSALAALEEFTPGSHPSASSIVTDSCLLGWECLTKTTWKSNTTFSTTPTNIASDTDSWNQMLRSVVVDASTKHQNELRQLHTTISIPNTIFPTQNAEGSQSSPCPESSVTDSRPESFIVTNTTVVTIDTDTATVTITNPAKETVTLTLTLHRSSFTSLTQWSNATAIGDASTTNTTAVSTRTITGTGAGTSIDTGGFDTGTVTANANTTTIGTVPGADIDTNTTTPYLNITTPYLHSISIPTSTSTSTSTHPTTTSSSASTKKDSDVTALTFAMTLILVSWAVYSMS